MFIVKTSQYPRILILHKIRIEMSGEMSLIGTCIVGQIHKIRIEMSGEMSLIGTCIVGQIRILILSGFAVVDWYLAIL